MIIGIDLGTVCCGYGIIEVDSSIRAVRRTERKNPPMPVFVTAGEVRMKRKDPLPERLKLLYHSLEGVIREYKPSHLCIEKIFYHKSIRSAFTLGSTRGIAMLLAAEHALPVFEYNPTEVKMALTGYGRAEKSQVQELVKRILRFENADASLSEDSSDALAVCICHVHSCTRSALQNA